jgi:hypothetical protein
MTTLRILVLICSLAGCYGCSKPLIKEPDGPATRPGNTSGILEIPIQKADFTNCDTTIVFGDSWSDYNVDEKNFVRMFADTSGQTIINTASTGLGSAHMVAKAYVTMSTVHNRKNVVTLCGFNDVRFVGATTELLNFQKNAYRALLANQFLETWRPAGSPSRYGGTFTSFIQSLTGHFKSYYSTGYKAAYTSSVNGVYLEYDFKGSNIGVSFVGQDTTALMSYEIPHGRWRVLIDGVVIDTPAIHQQAQGHTPGYMANQRMFPFIKIYSGLSPGNHVLRLEPIEAGNKFVDFIFTLRDPAKVSPVTIMKVPYMTDAGYTIDAFASQADDAAIDKVNQAINDVRNEFIAIDPRYSKKIKLINTCDYFDKNKDYMSDLVHPNANGKANLLKALRSHINY